VNNPCNKKFWQRKGKEEGDKQLNQTRLPKIQLTTPLAKKKMKSVEPKTLDRRQKKKILEGTRLWQLKKRRKRERRHCKLNFEGPQRLQFGLNRIKKDPVLASV